MGQNEFSELKRRDFLKGMGLGTMGLISMSMLAGCDSGGKAQAEVKEEIPTPEPSNPAPSFEKTVSSADLVALGASSMSVYELNQRRRELIDSKGDYTCEDGTVIPAVWNKLRTLVDTIGWGCGTAKGDNAFDFFKFMFSEEEAEAYLTMPMGVMFSPWEWAAETGRDQSECEKMCEDFANRGLLWRARRSGMTLYHQVAVAHGIYEYNLDRFFEEGFIEAFGTCLTFDETEGGTLNSGTPFYYAIPCDESIVGDEKIIVGDDWKQIVARHDIIGVSPCQCRMARMVREGNDPVPPIGSEELKTFMDPNCGHPIETCLSFGEEAAYYIERGIAREITQDEAIAILERSVEHGMVIQSCYTRDTEIICSCHGDCCGILGGYVAAGPEAAAAANSYPNNSNYDLVYDKENCIKCGSCVDQCTMFAITLDEEKYPVVNDLCVRCGQCGMVCPQGVRTLTLNEKAPERFLTQPATLLEDYNMQAKFRFENGWIH